MSSSNNNVQLSLSPGLFKVPTSETYCFAAEAMLRMSHVDFDKTIETSGAIVPKIKGNKAPKSEREGFYSIVDAVPARSVLMREEGSMTLIQKVQKKAFCTLIEDSEGLTLINDWVLAGTQSAVTASKKEIRRTVSIGTFRRYCLSNALGRIDAAKVRCESKELTDEIVTEKLIIIAENIVGILGAKDWILGTKIPTTVDALAFGFLGPILYRKGVTKYSSMLIHNFKPLVDYMERIRLKYFEVYSLSLRIRRLDTGDEDPVDYNGDNEVTPLYLCSAQTLAAVCFSSVYFVVINRQLMRAILAEH